MDLVEATVTVDDVDAFVERLAAVGDEHDVTVQAFDARYVVDRTHLERAVALADRAFDRGENVARDRAVEILCYAAGRRQIDRALTIGVSAGECPALVLVDAPSTADRVGVSDAAGPDASAVALEDSTATDGECAAAAAVASLSDVDPAETLGDYDPELVRDFFEVGRAELATVDGDLPALVRERVALLAVEK